ncbi:MAG: tetratricopeptide repeat protein [Rhizonema sp. PD37]|nr:tetratricopeptide repeat protein [Rhizonema sp. PD37]
MSVDTSGMKPRMQLNIFFKSVFCQTATCFILGILAVTNTSRPLLAEDHNFAVTNIQTQKVAQQLPGANEAPEEEKLNEAANQLINKGDLPGAEVGLRKLIKKYPENIYGHYQLGNVLFKQGKKEDAIKEFRQVIRLDSKYAIAFNAVGQVMASEERWDDAITEYQKALKINSEYGEAITNMALSFLGKGNTSEAIASLEKAQKVFNAQGRPERAKRVEQIMQDIKAGKTPTLS